MLCLESRHVFKCPSKSGVDSSYFYYVAIYALRQMLAQVQDATMEHIQQENSEAIPLSLADATQNKSGLRRFGKADGCACAAIRRPTPRNIAPSLFLEMFGDPMTNPMKAGKYLNWRTFLSLKT